MNDYCYTISETADILGISIPTLRLYEREGLIIVHRRNSKHRRYSQDDIHRIRCLRNMINNEKISLEGIKRLLSMIPCWKIRNCPDDARKACSAFSQADKPCWMASGKSWKCKSDECRECIVYTGITDCHSLKQAIAHSTMSAGESTAKSNFCFDFLSAHVLTTERSYE